MFENFVTFEDIFALRKDVDFFYRFDFRDRYEFVYK